jgi:hypothetical protein
LLACGGCSAGRLIEAARLGIEVAAGTEDPAVAEVDGMRRQVILAGQAGDLYLPCCCGRRPIASLC